MTVAGVSPYLQLLRDRIDLVRIPFSERGSRLMVFRVDGHFAVRLAERWFRTGDDLAAYRRRPSLIDRWSLCDEHGQPLECQLTTYPHRIDCQTARGTFTITFADQESLFVALPPGRAGMSFLARVDAGQVDRRGGVLRLVDPVGRSIAYTTNARLWRNSVSALGDKQYLVELGWEAGEGCGLILNVTPRLGFNRYVGDVSAIIGASGRAWHEWFARAPAVDERFREQYYYAWWVLRAGLISSRYYTTREAMTPSKPHYVGVWQWDAYFHALAYRHVEPRLAQDQLRVLLDHQRADGMIPDAVYDEGVVTHLSAPVEADVTKPPLIAWTAWKLYEMDGDREFLEEIYEPIVRNNAWWFEASCPDDTGLCAYYHPYSSGLDNSPLWDDGLPVKSPDLNTYLVLQQEALGRIARVIGDERAARDWARRARDLAHRMLSAMWDEEAGLFWPMRGRQPVRVRTPFSLFPLLTGRLPKAVVRRMVAELTDPRSFWSPYPVPTVALNDPRHDPECMWRGPTWVNVNYSLIHGLRRSGEGALARQLRERTLAMIAGQRDIHEFYHPLSGVAPHSAAGVFGWSAALFIELLLERQAEKMQSSAVDSDVPATPARTRRPSSHGDD